MYETGNSDDGWSPVRAANTKCYSRCWPGRPFAVRCGTSGQLQGKSWNSIDHFHSFYPVTELKPRQEEEKIEKNGHQFDDLMNIKQ